MVDQTCSTSIDEARFDSARLMLAAWAAEVPDGLIRKSLVIDRFLDLRAELGDEPLLKIEVDQLLAKTPGNTVVEAAWWLSSVSTLTEAVTARAVAVREDADGQEVAVES
ncbi:MAG TPA: hypothetical protein VL068_10280 [Microthrixaceae bacterium]|nr:hypothetical protein [Microthrixaceae bacterium]